MKRSLRKLSVTVFSPSWFLYFCFFWISLWVREEKQKMRGLFEVCDTENNLSRTATALCRPVMKFSCGSQRNHYQSAPLNAASPFSTHQAFFKCNSSDTIDPFRLRVCLSICLSIPIPKAQYFVPHSHRSVFSM